MRNIYAVYGASGCGRSLMPVAAMQLTRMGIDCRLIFIDDSLDESSEVNGYVAMNYDMFKALDDNKYVLIAIANSNIRQ